MSTTSLAVADVPALLDELKALWPASPSSDAASSQVIRNPYDLIVATVFSGANRPELVPAVCEHAIAGLSTDEAKALVARRLRDALFKGGILTGYSRAINSLMELHASLPDELKAAKFGSERGLGWATVGVAGAAETSAGTSTADDPLVSANLGAAGGVTASSDQFLQPGGGLPTLAEITTNGYRYYRTMYGDNADTVQNLLDAIYPDMGYFSCVVGYGLVYGGAEHLLNMPETSIVLVSALIAVDTPRQVAWHIANARRLGVSLEQGQALREIAMRAARAAGVSWRAGVPEVA